VADLRELQRRLESLKALREIVHAMRNLAATYVRWAEVTLEAARPYGEVVETALAVVLDRLAAEAPSSPEGSRDASPPVGLAVVFGSDQGLCGAYNRRVVEAALALHAAAPGRTRLATVGRRPAGLLALEGVEPALVLDAPTSLEGIKARVSELAAVLLRFYLRSGARDLRFVFNAYEGAGRFTETVRRVLPTDRARLRATGEKSFPYAPILTAPPAALLGALSGEYFFIELYRALLESHASENGARLAAMTAASSNIDDRLGELTREFQSARQEAITAELLDVVAGAEALESERP